MCDRIRNLSRYLKKHKQVKVDATTNMRISNYVYCTTQSVLYNHSDHL